MGRRTQRRLWLGIDPGQKGYFCVYDGERIVTLWAIPYRGKEVDHAEVRRILIACRRAGVVFAVIEVQRVYGKQGAVSGGNTIGGYQALKTALVWSRIPFLALEPEDWKRMMGIRAPMVATRKRPRKPKKGSPEEEFKAWEDECEEVRKHNTAAKKKVRKGLAIDVAYRLQPGYDFRTSDAWNAKTSDGKCEAFLLSVVAHKINTETKSDDDEEAA